MHGRVDISWSLQRKWWLTSWSCRNWRWAFGKTHELWDQKTTVDGSQWWTMMIMWNCRKTWMNCWGFRWHNCMTIELISWCTVISALIWMETMLKNSLRVWITNVYNTHYIHIFPFTCILSLFQNLSLECSCN